MHGSAGVWPYSAQMHFKWDISHSAKLKYAANSFSPVTCQFSSICLFCLSLKREHTFSGRFFVTYLVWYKEKNYKALPSKLPVFVPANLLCQPQMASPSAHAISPPSVEVWQGGSKSFDYDSSMLLKYG